MSEVIWTDELPPEVLLRHRKIKADWLRSLPKEIRWIRYLGHPPAYLIRRGVTSSAQGILLAQARLGESFFLESWMERELEKDALVSDMTRSRH